jgi:hypothetical protein
MPEIIVLEVAAPGAVITGENDQEEEGDMEGAWVMNRDGSQAQKQVVESGIPRTSMVNGR